MPLHLWLWPLAHLYKFWLFEAFPIKFLINLNISLEFLMYISWKPKVKFWQAVQATLGGFSPKCCLQWKSPLTLGLPHKSKDFCSGLGIRLVLLCFLNSGCSSLHCLPGHTRSLRVPQGGKEVCGRRMSVEGKGYLTFLSSKFVKSRTAERHRCKNLIQSKAGFWS